MDVREKLVELLTEFYGSDPMYYGIDALAMAQHLIANGVTVQVCKLEDKKTNADRIRSMSDEELAEQLGLMTTICEFCAKQKNCEDAQDYNCCMEGILNGSSSQRRRANNGKEKQ